MPKRKRYLFVIGADDVIHSRDVADQRRALCGDVLREVWWEGGWLPSNYRRCLACLRARPRNADGAIPQSDPYIRFVADDVVVHERSPKDHSRAMCGHLFEVVWMQRQHKSRVDDVCADCSAASAQARRRRAANKSASTGMATREKKLSGTTTPPNIKEILAKALREGRKTQSRGRPNTGAGRPIRFVSGGAPGLGKRS